MRRRTPIITLALAALMLTPGVATAQPTSGGCAAFGGNVAHLAITQGADFGATASFVATTFGPRAFPNMVVFPEQEEHC
jgi:hypothetical protein